MHTTHQIEFFVNLHVYQKYLFLFFTFRYSCLTNFISKLSTWKYCIGAFRRIIFI